MEFASVEPWRLSLVVVEQAVEVGPGLDFSPPLLESGERRKNQERSQHFFVHDEVVEKGNDLYGFSEAHFVS